MKKHLFPLLILAIALSGAAKSQTASGQTAPAAQVQTAQTQKSQPLQRWSFDLMAGGSIPVGQFAHTDRQNPTSGQVHTGNDFEFSSTYHITRHWGITALAGTQYNNSDIDKKIFPMDVYIAYALQKQHWSMTRLLLGGAYTYPISRKQHLSLEIRALGGIQQTHASKYSYVFPAQANELTLSDYLPGPDLHWSFSYQADAGLNWQPFRHWALLAYGGYNGCRPSYNLDFWQLVAPSSNAPYLLIKNLHFPTGSILLRAGVQYSL